MNISSTLLPCLAFAGVITLAACGSDEDIGNDISATEVRGPTMRPGENCLRCHSPTGGVGAPTWSAGGTIYPKRDANSDEGVEGVDVMITDANGKVVSLVTNSVGNFFTDEELAKPYRVAITYEGRRKEMPIAAPAGSCNACHSWPDRSGGAPGRIYVP